MILFASSGTSYVLVFDASISIPTHLFSENSYCSVLVECLSFLFFSFFFFLFLDAQARLLIPSLPPLRLNDRISHHYRFIAPLMPTDDEGRSPLHYYDSAIQLARQADREPTEREFEVGIAAADEIKKMYVHDISRQVL